MKIVKLSYTTDEGKIYELATEEDTQEFIDSFQPNVRIQLGFAFCPNLSGGLNWQVKKN
jgi:hypothetical protein